MFFYKFTCFLFQRAYTPTIISKCNYFIELGFFFVFYIEALLTREEVVPEFWVNFKHAQDLQNSAAFNQFERAVTQLHAKMASFAPGLQAGC